MKGQGVASAEHMEILREAMKYRDMKQSILAEKLGMRQPSLSGNMNRVRIGLDVFARILDAMDYDVVVVDRTTGEEKWRVRL